MDTILQRFALLECDKKIIKRTCQPHLGRQSLLKERREKAYLPSSLHVCLSVCK